MTLKIWNTETNVATGSGVDREMVASLPNGGYVVVWRDTNKIYFQLYNGLGAKVGAAKLLTDEARSHTIADIEVDQVTGNFAISWNSSENSTPGSFRYSTRVFDINGERIDPSNETTLAPNLSIDNGDAPAMARNGNDGYVTVYDGGSTINLIVQNNSGAEVRRLVIDAETGVGNVDVTALGGGRFVVSYVGGGNNPEVRTKVIDLNAANPVPTIYTVVGGGGDADVVALKNENGQLTGAYAVTIQNGATVQTKTYRADGSLNHTYSISTTGMNQGDYVHATALSDGRMAVLYSATTQSPFDNGDIFLKIIDPSKPASDPSSVVMYPTRINLGSLGSGQQYTPTITEMKDGRIALAWYDPSKDSIAHVIVDSRLESVTVEGLASNDIYVGSEYDNDILRGNGGNDTLYGGDGNDNFNGGAGVDRFVGGDHLGKDNGTADNVSYWGAKNAQGQLEAVEIYLWNVSSNKGYEAEGDTYVGIEVISGTVLNDTIEGDNANNAFWGDNGDDVLKGFGGNDTLQGANGNDLLHGGNGNDILVGGDGADTFYGGAGVDAFHGGVEDGGRNVVTYEYSTAGTGVSASLRDARQNTGEAAGDSYVAIDDLIGTAWNDELIGIDFIGSEFASIHNKLSGGGGDDTLEGLNGADTLDGGTGFNFASYKNATAAVRTSLGLTVVPTREGDAVGDEYVAGTIQGLIGSRSDDALAGSDNWANELRGGEGNDSLYGGTGSDTLMGGAGNDSLDGGGNFDFVSYLDSTNGVTIALPGGGSGTVAGDTLVGIEGLIGSAHGDTLTGNEANNHLKGEGGNDGLTGGGGTDTLEGGAGDDVLNGGAGADRLEGGIGSDTYYVAAGDRIVEHAGQGTDTVVITSDFVLTGNDFANIENIILDVSTLNNTLTGSETDNVLTGNDTGNRLEGLGGNDTLYGLGGNDGLFGGAGDDALFGGAGIDALFGDAGNDILDGGTGIDAMNGGVGNDVYYVNDAGDSVVEAAGGGIDTVYASVNFNMGAGTEVEYLYATGAAGLILTGSNFANTIIGNAGANKIYGGLGNDFLTGGAGKDIFVFDTKPNKSTNVDRIMDFNVRDDSFHLDNKYFTKLGSGTASKPKKFNSDMFVINNKAKDREDRVVYDKKTGALYYDQDGTGSKAQIKIATLNKNLKLTYSDFFVI